MTNTTNASGYVCPKCGNWVVPLVIHVCTGYKWEFNGTNPTQASYLDPVLIARLERVAASLEALLTRLEKLVVDSGGGNVVS